VHKLAAIDITIILLYLAGMLVIGFLLGSKQKTSQDYFLAGRKLKWWMIGFSMVATDIGSLELVGVAGGAYVYGMVLANFDWIACTVSMIIAAFIFIPFYWKAGVYTIPEYLGRRYNSGVYILTAIIWGLFMVANLGLLLWAAAKTVNVVVGWPMPLTIVLIAVVVGFYTFSGGLAAVVYTDVVQCIILIIGSVVLLAVGLVKIGGIDGLVHKVSLLPSNNEYYLRLVLPADTKTPFSWSAVLLGLGFVLGPAYWAGNQVIVQRCLGASSQHEVKKSVIFGASLKIIFPILMVVPGIIGFVLYPKLKSGDDIYATMLCNLLPKGVFGLVFTGFLAAFMSTVDSYLNSAATLWTMDIYKRYIKKEATPHHLMVVGKILTVIFIILAAYLAPMTTKFSGIFNALQTLLSIFQGPTLAILLLGMLWKRANSPGAIAGLVVGVLTSSMLFWVQADIFRAKDPYLYIAWWSFLMAVVVTVAVSLCTRAQLEEKIKNLMFSKES
jgi:SSS family solute:Na+ symporter